jgi:hypothetical protein
MLDRYQDFLLESILLESVVVYSDKFKQILKEVDSPVAQAVLDLESMDLDVANNYIDVQDKEQISFIADRKAKELLSQKDKFATYNGGTAFLRHSEGNREIFDLLEYEPVGEATYKPNTGDKGEVLKMIKSPTSDNIYVKMKFEGGISVMNKSCLDFTDINKLPFQQNRQAIRIGRGIRTLLSKTDYKFTDSEIEQFVNKYKSAWDAYNDIFRKFELVSGKDIAHWYSYRNYALIKGTLGSSCMRGVDEEYFNIYVNNPDKCSLLILKSDDDSKIKGRALVWKLDQPEVTFMDRIYTTADSDIELFKQYAYKNGWYHKEHQTSSGDAVLVGQDGIRRESEFVINLKNYRQGRYDNYPYLDTLKYFVQSTGKLSTNSRTPDKITLEDTGGHYSEYNSCDSCGGDGRVDCYECDGEGRVNCGECYSRSQRRSTGSIECENCIGRGDIDCDDCDATGEVDCSTCNGSGEVDGQECSDCSGKGKVECDECSGKGNRECPECDGAGENECAECEGDGRIECGACDGDGRVDCSECS